jgi:hypothetical protein
MNEFLHQYVCHSCVRFLSPSHAAQVADDALLSISVCTVGLVLLKPLYTQVFTGIFSSLGATDSKSLNKVGLLVIHARLFDYFVVSETTKRIL